ncbi:hypothetical protein [Streptomyces sp. NPDC050560]|uniref:hypothetical protein n=1 Tax=Streptomyces sp. NPDC050560 TaxID=3365630 RepID=UPI003797B6F2
MSSARPALRRLVVLLPVVLVFLLVPPAAAFTVHTASAAVMTAPEAPEPEPHPAPGPSAADGAHDSPTRPAPTPGPTPAPDRPAPERPPPASPEPTPGPTPQACAADGDPSDCDNSGGFGLGEMLDIPGMIVNAVTSFLGTLVEQIMKPVREFLADTLLATPDVTGHADIKRMWTGTLTLTVGIYVLFVTAGGITVMGHETVQSRYTLRQIAPRLLLGMTAAATSLTVMAKAISLSNALAHAIMATDLKDAGQGAVERVLPFALFGAPGLQLYLLVIGIVMIVLVLAVVIGFFVRIAVMALLAVAAPLMLACHAHPLSDPVARLWWRALAGCLVIQVAQSLTFVLALKLFFAPGATTLGIPRSDQLGTMLAGVALFWVLFKIPGWTLQVVLRGTPLHNPHVPSGVRMLKHLAMYRIVEHYLPGRVPLGRGPGGGGFGIRHWGGPGGGGLPGGGGGRPNGPRPSPRSRTRTANPAQGPETRIPVAAPESHRPAPERAAPRGPGPAGSERSPGREPLPGRPMGAAFPPPQKAPPSRPGPQAAPVPRALRGPGIVTHPAQARRTQQLALPVTAERVPARPPRPTQLWLPITAERSTAPPGSPVPPPAPPRGLFRSTADRPVPRSPRTRQMTLPVAAPRVRVRPPRPVQLWLPLEPPRR